MFLNKQTLKTCMWQLVLLGLTCNWWSNWCLEDCNFEQPVHLFLGFVFFFQLLDALELTQSPLLLKLVAGILCRDRKHIMEEQFQTCFQIIAKRSVKASQHLSQVVFLFCFFYFCSEKSNASWVWQSVCTKLHQSCLIVSTLCVCLTRSSSERQLQLLCAVYGVIQQGDMPMTSTLQAMMERVLLPLASHCSTKAFSDFFVANVSEISAVLLCRFIKVCFSVLLQLENFF